MSYIRIGENGRYTDVKGLYAYPTDSWGDETVIQIAGGPAIEYSVWAELTGRILERHIDDEEMIETVVDAIMKEYDKFEAVSSHEDNGNR